MKHNTAKDKKSKKTLIILIGVILILLSLTIGAITQEEGESADTIYMFGFYTGIIVVIVGCFMKSQKKLDLQLEQENNKIQLLEDGWIEKNKNLLINEEKKKIMLYKEELNFEDILDAELISDGTTIAKTDFTSMAVRSFVFGAVGGITAKKNNVGYCNDLRIKITTKNLSDPVKYLTFIYGFKINKNSFIYKNKIDEANTCLSIFQIIINQNNNKTN